MSDEQIDQLAQVFTPVFEPAPAAPSLAERIVAEAVKHLGEHETRGNGLANDGPPVEWSCKRWISESRYAYLLREGKLEWCAGWACSILDEIGSKAVHEIASLQCTTLWAKASAEIERESTEGVERTIHQWPAAPMVPGLPQPGDLLLTDRDLNGKPNHVAIVERIEGTTIHTIGGNQGKHIDEVTRHKYQADAPELFGFIRVLS